MQLITVITVITVLFLICASFSMLVEGINGSWLGAAGWFCSILWAVQTLL